MTAQARTSPRSSKSEAHSPPDPQRPPLTPAYSQDKTLSFIYVMWNARTTQFIAATLCFQILGT